MLQETMMDITKGSNVRIHTCVSDTKTNPHFNLPVESANMIIMSLAHAQASGDGALLTRHVIESLVLLLSGRCLNVCCSIVF